MNTSREPNVRIRAARTFGQLRTLGTQNNSGLSPRRATLTLGLKVATQRADQRVAQGNPEHRDKGGTRSVP
jgi:hypothetical protein